MSARLSAYFSLPYAARATRAGSAVARAGSALARAGAVVIRAALAVAVPMVVAAVPVGFGSRAMVRAEPATALRRRVVPGGLPVRGRSVHALSGRRDAVLGCLPGGVPVRAVAIIDPYRPAAVVTAAVAAVAW
ncbi:hypothetical protein [Nonomuraea jiangxiensis]|uniref:Uncharacterized protein n=1 Tax=Nonomuraea jiangxiensis TaxID=633440 RepID=A0A1G9D3Q2_9ACTN|nr:hypothetical protein [Nonomuraea jiangxiensis]SDK58539.1 hypothetical protein SAMN05421869_1175 [Nonomuraea jiangxiensis]